MPDLAEAAQTSGSDGSFGTKRVGELDRFGNAKMIRWTFDNNTESNTAGDSGGQPLSQLVVRHIAGIASGGELASAGIGDNGFDTRVECICELDRQHRRLDFQCAFGQYHGQRCGSR
ncbi:MAG: hypothetical protein U0930_13430 [Pirellulales bacterium]